MPYAPKRERLLVTHWNMSVQIKHGFPFESELGERGTLTFGQSGHKIHNDPHMLWIQTTTVFKLQTQPLRCFHGRLYVSRPSILLIIT